MWKTHLTYCEHKFYISTGVVEKMWKTHLPVDKNERNVSFHVFHRCKKSPSCGNVENFV